MLHTKTEIRKVILTFIMICFALLLTACGQKSDDADDTPPNAQAGNLYEDFFTGDVTVMANLINAGILPLTFAEASDYDRLHQGDELTLSGIYAGMESGRVTLTDRTTGEEIALSCAFTPRQAAILKAGGLLNYTSGRNYHDGI